MKRLDADPIGQDPIQIQELMQCAKKMGARMHHRFDILEVYKATSYSHAVPDGDEDKIPKDAINIAFIKVDDVLYANEQGGHRAIHCHPERGERLPTMSDIPYKIESIASPSA